MKIARIYPLTPMQEGMLFHALLEPDSPAYYEQLTFTVHGDFDPALFETAFNRLIARHEVLRSVFAHEKLQKPRMVVLQERWLKVHFADLRNLETAVQATEIARLQQSDAERGFDLARDMLTRLIVIRTADDAHTVIWSHHHILMDGWCTGTLLSELLQVYSGLRNDTAINLPPPPVYADYMAWLGKQDTEAATDYWTKRLAGYGAQVTLPRFRDTSEGEQMVSFELPTATVEQLKAIAAEANATFSSIVQAAWGVLLQRYNDTDDAVFGAVVSGRPPEVPGIERMVGLFINTIPVRIKTGEETTFAELLRETQAHATDADAYHAFPLAEAQACSPMRGELLDHLLVFENYPVDDSIGADRYGELGFRFGDSEETEKTNYDLTVLVNLGETLHVRLKYNGAAFDASTMQSVSRHFENILAEVAQSPGMVVHKIQMLAPYATPELSRVAPQEPVIRAFESFASRDPDSYALSVDNQKLSYSDLNKKANICANELIGKYGVQRGDKVGLMTGTNEWLMIGMLGILKTGAAYVPIDPNYPEERIQLIVEDAGLDLVLVTDSQLENAKTLDLRTLQEGDDHNPKVEITGQDLAYVIYTSGSTGRPKGTLIDHNCISRLLSETAHWYGFGAADVWTMFHSYAFDFSVWEIWGALAYGGRLVLVRSEIGRSPEDFRALLIAEGVTVLNQTPTAFYQLAEAELAHAKPGLNALRWVIFGGEALNFAMLRGWIDRYGLAAPRLVNMYGITETTVHVTFYELQEGDSAHGSSIIGVPIPDLEIVLLDSRLRPTPEGAVGEIGVSGPGLARGYLNRPEQTAARFIDHPFRPGARIYRSGDLARMRPDGLLEYHGRMDHQLKIRGFRIEPGEIETRLLDLPDVQSAVVLGKEVNGEKELVAYIVGKAAVADLRAELAVDLPDYMIPAWFLHLDEIPMTINGKVDRRALPDVGAVSKDQVGSYMAPRNETESALVTIWEEILHCSPVGIDDNFFELGGHSLKAVSIMGRIRKEIGAQVSLKALFEYPTIRELAHSLAPDDATDDAIPRIPTAKDYAIGPTQQRLWVLHQLESDPSAYNVPGAVLLEGPIDAEALQKALKALLKRHESLRTGFRGEQGTARQFIVEAEDWQLEMHDLRQETDPEAVARAWCETDASRAFDLTAPPLLRAALLHLGQERHVLTLNLHHIICDGWSLGILMRELSHLYAQASRKETPSISPLPIQYKDFSDWQVRTLSSDAVAQLRSYWTKQLAGPLPVLNLPADYKRPAMKTYNGASIDFDVPAETIKGFEAMLRAEGASLYMGLMTLFKVLLYRYTNQTDLVVGTPVNGRSHPDLAGLVGFFVNTLAIRSQVDGEQNFHAALRKVKNNILAGIEHEAYPFDLLVDEIKVERDVSRSPVFDVMLSLDIDRGEGFELSGLRTSPFSGNAQRSQFDLSFHFSSGENGLRGTLDYNTDIYAPERMQRMTGHFTRLLHAVLDQKNTTISRLSYLSAEEINTLTEAFAGPRIETPAMDSIHALIEARAAAQPEAVAVRFEQRRLTFGELDQKANQLAHQLRAAGVGAETSVGVLMPRSEAIVVALLAIWKAGGAYVALDPDYPAERVAYMLSDSGTQHLITAPGVHVPRAFDGTELMLELSQLEGPTTPPEPVTKPEHLAYFLYTSGSTGRPKGVMIEHRNVIAFLAWCREEFAADQFDIGYVVTSICFDLSVYELFYPLSVGKAIRIVESGLHLREEMQYDRNILLNTVPSLVLALLDQGELFPHVSVLNMAGEPIPVKILSALKDEGILIRNLYGPSEDTTYSTCYRFERNWKHVLIGKPVGNTWIYITDARGELLPQGIAGEIRLSGDGVARGYLNRPEMTAEKFSIDPRRSGQRMYRTGDLGRWLPDGNLEFLGRIDQQVKVRGFRIEPGEIELKMQAFAGIEKAIVIMRVHPEGDQQLIGYYVGQDGKAVELAALRNHLAQSLPRYMMPNVFMRIDAVPLTPNGKLDRKALPVPDVLVARKSLAENGQNGKTVALIGETERQLAAIWEALLEEENIGREADFFALGGNSLLLLSLMAQISKTFEVDLLPAQLFRTSRLAEQAALIATLGDISRHVYADAPVLLNDEAPRKLFCLPPLFGDSLIFRDFAAALENTAFYGFNFIVRPERMAGYITEIQRLQPEGPYQLMGYSSGGNLAFRLAREMEARGLEVENLFIFDATRRMEPEAITEAEAREYVDRLVRDFAAYFRQQYALDERLMARVRERIFHYYIFLEGQCDDGIVDANIHLLRSTNTSSEMEVERARWGEVTRGDFVQHAADGVHAEMMNSAQARANARFVTEILNQKQTTKDILTIN